MATTISQTNEMQIQLKDITGEYQRILRIPNPQDEITREEVEQALAPAIAVTSTSGGSTLVPYFYDDTDPTKGLTVLGTVEIVKVTREVTSVE